jgi:type IV secretory pathway TraG/TraD family ATPase VirD4
LDIMLHFASQLAQVCFLYAVTAFCMAAAHLYSRASWHQYVRLPLRAVATFAVALCLWMLLRTAWIPVLVTHLNRGLAVALGIGYFMMFGTLVGLTCAGSRRNPRLKRGTHVVEQRTSARASARTTRRPTITLAGVPVEPLDETKHFKLIGTTGTGKSTAIREILRSALARGDRAVIADPDGGYLDRFFEESRGDLILNPFDRRSRGWDLFSELNDGFDVEQLARALIPDTEGGDRSWRGYARTFFTAVTQQLWGLVRTGGHTISVSELYRVLTMASHEELKVLVQDTPAQAFLERGNERMFGSIRSVAADSIAALQYVARHEGVPLSLRHWIRSAPRHRALFLPYSATQIAALRSLISAWLRLTIFETMSGPDRDQRLWFIIDELDALGTIDGLKDALARLRKFGGRCVLGFQSIAQVSDTYGHGEAQTIVENCGNTLVLRCSASEQGGTARFASRLIGDRELIRPHQTRSRRSGEWRSTRSFGEQHVTEAAVLPSEIEQLPDLAGYAKLASSPSWRRVNLRRS